MTRMQKIAAQNIVSMDFMDVHFRIRQEIIRQRDRGKIRGRVVAILPSPDRLRKIGEAESFTKALAVAEKRAPRKVWIVKVPIRDEYDMKRELIEDNLESHPYGCVRMDTSNKMSFDL